MSNSYKIEDNDRFSNDLYPRVVEEIAGLHQTLIKIKSPHKSEILISFLKDHSIKSALLAGNKEIIERLRSGSLATSHLESLFNGCKGNPSFLSGLEEYIRLKIF